MLLQDMFRTVLITQKKTPRKRGVNPIVVGD